jgi:RimJ/RimL family protein N-acetyltransferase
MAEFRLETDRLILRDWRDADRIAFHAINTDPRVMRFLGPLMTLDDVDALIARLRDLQARLGHCFWAVERKEDGRLIGWCGLIRGAEGTPISGQVEVGWRLAYDMWGQGYAHEAASAAISWAFHHLPDESVWAITVENNDRSWGLMERLGMARHPELGFDHPNVPEGSPLRPHIAYSVDRAAWASTQFA